MEREQTTARNATQGILWRAFFAIGFSASVLLGLHLGKIVGEISILWPASSILCATLLLAPVARRAEISGIAVVGSIIIYFSSGYSLERSAIFSLLSILEAVLYSWVLIRLCGTSVTFGRPREIAVLISIAILLNGAMALPRAFVSTPSSGMALFDNWLAWWISDGLSLLILVPLIVMWTKDQDRPPTFTIRTAFESVIITFALTATVWFIVGPGLISTNEFILSYIIFPILIWSAFRFRPRSTSTILFIFAMVILGLTIKRADNLITTATSRMDELLSMESMLGIAAVTSLLLAATVADWKRKTSLLAASEARYRSLFEQSHDAVFILDLEGNHVSANQRAADMLGYSLEEIQKISIWETSSEPEKSKEILKRIVAGEQIPLYERRFRKKNGEFFPVEINLELVRDAEGKPLHIQSVVRDVSQRKQVEQALWESEERYRLIFNSVQDAIFVETLDGQILAVNDRACELYGFTREEFLTKTVADLVPSGKPVLMLANDAVSLSPLPTINLRSNGEEFPIEISGRQQFINGEKVQVMIVHDLTDRKRVEQTLRESEERFHSAFDFAAIGMALVAPNGRWIKVNRALCDLVGYPERELLNKTFQDITHPDDLETDLAYLRQLLAGTRRTYQMEKRYIHQQGQIVWVLLNVALVRDDQSNPLYFISQIQDITGRKQAEKALRESEEQYRGLFENMAEGFAYCRMIFEDGQPKDWLYLKVNSAFEGLTGLRDISGKRVTEAIPGVRESNPELFEIYGRVALTGNPAQFETYVQPLDMWFSVSVYSPERQYFVAVFTIITERKQAEEKLRRRAEELNALQATLLGITAPHSLPELLKSIVERATSLLHGTGGGLYLTEPENHLVRCVVSYKTKRDYTGTVLNYGEGAAGHVAESGRSMMINDYGTWSGRGAAFDGDNPFHKVLSAPLLWRGNVTGIIHILRDKHAEVFSEADLELLELFANHAAVAVENARLFNETRERLLELETLHNVSGVLRAARTVEDSLPILIDAILQALDTDSGMIMLYDSVKDELSNTVKRGWFTQLPEAAMKPGQGIAGTVFSSGQIHISPEFGLDPLADPASQPHVRSGWGGVCVPICTAAETIGVIFVSVPLPRRITAEQTKMLNSLAEMTGTALHRIRLNEETSRRAEEFAALYQTSAVISGEHELDNLLQTIVKQAATLLHASGAGMYLFDPVNEELENKFATESSFPIGVKLKLGEAMAGRVALTRKPMRVDDYSVWANRSEKLDAVSVHAVLEVPMLYAGELIGVLVAEELGDSQRKYSDDDERLLSLFAAQAAGAIRSARLYQEAVRRVKYLQSLRSIDRAITANMDSNVTFKILLNQAINQMNFSAAAILLFNPNTLTLNFALGQGFRTNEMERVSVRLGESYAGVVALERRLISLTDFSSLPPGRFKDFIEKESFLSCYIAPMIAKGQIQGVMEIYSRERAELDHEEMEFLEALTTQAAIAVDNAHLFRDLQHANFELTMAYDATIDGWSQALDERFKEVEGHTERVTELTIRLARAAGVEEKSIGHIRRGAILHDIGNMGIPDSILQKTSPLTEEEMQVVRGHPEFGYKMLAHVNLLRPALDIIHCHHEKWDGTGYPRGLRGEQIPLAARIFSVIDAWDALTSARPQRAAWSKKKALAHIQSQAGKQFDPKIVNLFLQLVSSMDKP